MNRAATTVEPASPLFSTVTVLQGAVGRLPATARLLVTEGPGKGAEVALESGSAGIGRGTENALVIPDISVSRRHARIEERGAGAWVLIDESSGNGTRLNGVPIREQRLRDGDEIAIGKSRLRFLEPGGIAAPTMGQPKRRPQFRLRAPLMLCAAPLALVLTVGWGAHRWRTLESGKRALAAREESRAAAQDRFRRAVALLAAGQREKAREDLEVAAELDPADEEIRGVRAALDQDAAKAHPAAPEAEKAAPPAQAPIAPPPPLMEAKLPAEAVKLPPAPPKSVPPRTRSAKATPRRRENLEHPGKKPQGDADAQAIVAAYRMGDLATARERARKSSDPEAARLAAALGDFERACREAAIQQTPADAVRFLDVAAATDRAIVGSGESKLGAEVRKALSAQHLLAAAALTTDAQLPQAAAHLRAAAAEGPSSQAAKDALRRVEDRVRDLYLRGYVARDADAAEARRCFMLVVQALPASDETAQKAKRWLDKLEGKAAE
jgi:hypothetical protein